MSASGSANASPRGSDSQFMTEAGENRNPAHMPVTLYASLSLDDYTKPTGYHTPCQCPHRLLPPYTALPVLLVRPSVRPSFCLSV